MKNKLMDFSVCMSVYKNDNANHFRTSVESVTIKQTLKPAELVLVIDGPVSEEIDKTIEGFQLELSVPMTLIRLPHNLGHAVARQTALDAAKYDYIAIMDSDDICEPTRFEQQITAIEQHPEVSVIGGQINEFIGESTNIVGKRIVPEEDTEIKKYLKSRCPMNLVTVMMNKKDVIDVGGYIDWYCEEDYYLWIRMTLAGCHFANIPENLVNVRVGKDMYTRRGGWKYFVSERNIQTFMLHKGMISLPRYIYNVVGRFVIQVMMPNSLRGWLFRKVFRKREIE